MTSDLMTSEPSLESLSRDECLALLRQGSLGRLAVVIDGQPHILPLNYAVDDDGVIVFRTADLTAATKTGLAKVAFEIDEIDVARRQGWSVAVHGFGRQIDDAIDRDSQRLLQMPVHPWAPGQRDRWFKITPKEITGRRLRTTGASTS
jgi:nitroimidazol reductase NimA-like FMN-containing flavoprotein (pyridoxamine 5'-phosphate oxidase superfamily)